MDQSSPFKPYSLEALDQANPDASQINQLFVPADMQPSHYGVLGNWGSESCGGGYVAEGVEGGVEFNCYIRQLFSVAATDLPEISSLKHMIRDQLPAPLGKAAAISRDWARDIKDDIARAQGALNVGYETDIAKEVDMTTSGQMVQGPQGVLWYAPEGADGILQVLGGGRFIVERDSDGNPMYMSGDEDGIPVLSMLISDDQKNVPCWMFRDAQGNLWNAV